MIVEMIRDDRNASCAFRMPCLGCAAQWVPEYCRTFRYEIADLRCPFCGQIHDISPKVYSRIFNDIYHLSESIGDDPTRRAIWDEGDTRESFAFKQLSSALMKYAKEKQSYPFVATAASVLTQAQEEGDTSFSTLSRSVPKVILLGIASALHEISNQLIVEYREDKTLEILDKAISATKLCITYTSKAGHHPVGETLNMMSLFLERYIETDNREELDHAIREGLRVHRPNHPLLSDLFAKLAMFFHLRDIKTASQNASPDLDQAIEFSSLAILHCPLSCPSRTQLQFNLAGRLIRLYHVSGHIELLDRAIEAAETAIPTSSTHAMPPLRAASALSTLALCLLNQYDRSKSLDILNRAITIKEESLCLIPSQNPLRRETSIELEACLSRRFDATSNASDVKHAIEVLWETLKHIPVSHTENGCSAHVFILKRLHQWLNVRQTVGKHQYSFGDFDDLEFSIAVLEELFSIRPESRTLFILADSLGRRFTRDGAGGDLCRSIELFELSKDLVAEDAPERLGLFRSFGSLIHNMPLDNQVDLESLKNILAFERRIFQSTIPDHLSPLAGMTALMYRLSKLSSEPSDDLRECMEHAEEILAKAPEDHPSRDPWLLLYGHALKKQFTCRGNLDDLHMAIQVQGELVENSRSEFALDATTKYRSDFPQIVQEKSSHQDVNLSNNKAIFDPLHQLLLGTRALARYNQVPALEDLDWAIKQLEAATEFGSTADVDLRERSPELAQAYYIRFNRGGRADDLDKAIRIQSKMLPEIRSNNWKYAMSLWQLSDYLARRSLLDGNSQESDKIKSEEYVNQCINAMQADNIPRRSQKGLVLFHLRRFTGPQFLPSDSCKERIPDLDRSIEILKRLSVNASKPDAGVDYMLGWAHFARYFYSKEKSPQDLETSAFYNSRFVRNAREPLIERIKLAQVTATILAELGRWKESLGILQYVIEMFPMLNLRSLSHFDQQHILKDTAGIASMAASMALQAESTPHDALRLLELGRGVIASLSMDMHGDFTKVISPDLEFKFLKAREKLDRQREANLLGLDDSVSRWVTDSRSRYEGEAELREIINDVQSNSQTRSVFGPPLMGELREAVGTNTLVVINASTYRCDAFLVQKTGPCRTIGLTTLKLGDIQNWVTHLRSHRPLIDLALLEWLWANIAHPILQALGFHYPPAPGTVPRIIWIMTGLLSTLPIHAAGIHGCRSTTVIDRVRSSYSSSLRAFVFGKNEKAQTIRELPNEKALLVGMGKTACKPELAELPYAIKEVDRLERLCQALSLCPIKLRDQSREVVLKHLAECTIFHFAGHGRSDPLDPFGSGLILADDLLTVADLRDSKLKLQGPFLGYLSACLTGANDIDDLIDESIHLISTCQLAGFRHVIGTLWQVSDTICVEVAEIVYKRIARDGLKDDSVCSGLHEALLHLRDTWAERELAESQQRGKRP